MHLLEEFGKTNLAHDILIFVSNYDKSSLNTNLPYVIGPSLNAFNWIFLPNLFLQFVWISNNNTHQKINNIVHILGPKLQNQLY